MNNQINQQDLRANRTFSSLMKIDSSIRNGQIVYAYRQSTKLLADLHGGNHDVDPSAIEPLTASVKRTVMFLKPLIASYAQNQSSIDILRRTSLCQKQQNSVQ